MTATARTVRARFAIVALLFALLASAFYAPVLRPGAVLLPTDFLKGFAVFAEAATDVRRVPWDPLRWDALAQYYPWRLFAHRELRKGVIPLWNPYQFSGMPFVANGQSAVFYPPNLLFYLMDPARAFGFSAALHAVIAALGMFALAKHLNLSDESAFVAGVAFMFNGFSLAWLELPTLMNAASWLPWILLCALRCLDAPTIARGAALSCALAVQILAGHLQIVQLSMFGLVIIVMIEALRLRRRPGLLTIVAAVLFALALAAIQLLPTLELSMNSHRAGAGDYGSMLARSLKLMYLLLPGSPYPALEPIHPESTAYVGLGIAALAIIGAVAKWRSQSASWTVLALVCISLVIGWPTCWVFYTLVPGAKQMGGFYRATVILCFALAVLTAFGCEAIREHLGKRPTGSNLVAPIVAAFLFVDMFYFCWSLNPTGERARVYPLTPITETIRQLAGNHRVLCLCDKRWLFRPHPEGTLPPNSAMVYELNEVQGYDTLQTNAYKSLMAKVEGGDQPAPATNGNLLLLAHVDSSILWGLGVRFVVSHTSLDSPVLRLLARQDGVWAYEMKTALELPRRTSVNTMEAQVGYKVMGATMTLPEAYYPGWCAWHADGSRAQVRRVAGALIGVPPSSTRTRLVFAPVASLFGGFVSLVGATVVVIVGISRVVGNAKTLELSSR